MNLKSFEGGNNLKFRAVDVFLRYLKAEGASVLFGIPGGLLHPLFEAVEADDDIRLIVTKHEEGAAFMADGHARVGGRLAVCAGTSGPGSTNLLTGVACAYADGVPMLVVTGQAVSQFLGKGAAQETGREDMDIVAMFHPVTKYSAMVTSAGSLSAHLRRALRLALTGRPGPVHLNIPVDIWEQTVSEDWFDPHTYRSTTRAFDRRKVQSAAEILLNAHHPVLLVGAGVGISSAQDQVRSLAEMLPARVVTSPRGKGLFPEDHPLSRGVIGFAGHDEARDLVFGKETDVLLTVGASLNETTTLNWHSDFMPSKHFLQLDIDPDRIGRNYPVNTPLVGDAQAILVEIVYHLHRMIREGGTLKSSWDKTALSTPRLKCLSSDEQRTSDQLPLRPQRWRADLEEALPDDAVIFSDIGGHMLFNIHCLCIKESQSFVLNMGFGSMGHGTAAPIGASLALPTRPVVAIVGDGCFTMNGMEMLTASEYNIPVVWIVENNNMHGVTWHGSQQVGKRRPLESVRYRRPLEVASIARAMGLRAWIVDTPGGMRGVLLEALSAGGPAVIEVRVDGSIAPPLSDRAQTIAGFLKE